MDIKLIRDDPQLVRDNQNKRFKDTTVIDKILIVDAKYKKNLYENEQMRSLKNRLSTCFVSAPQDTTYIWDDHHYTLENLIADLTNDTKDAHLLTREQLKQIVVYLNSLISLNNVTTKQQLQERDEMIAELGNVLHTDVVISDDENHNKIIHQTEYVPIKEFSKNPESHIELVEKLGFVNTTDGINVSGGRGYFLTGFGVRLNMALMTYAINFLNNEEYQLMYTPHFVTKEFMSQITQLGDYEETLYKLDGYDKYLIATSEQPITAFFDNKTYKNDQLPIKVAGSSTCYRKEVGSTGRHTRGIYRVHQFEKIEQFCVTHPDKSWDMFHKMMELSMKFYDSLGISYRVVNIVSGALNNAASMKYDLEAWYPGTKQYCELVSCTNCLDYFSKRIKLTNTNKEYLHMLNCTLCANTRTICALLETYQTDTGFTVPEVLRPYLDGTEFVPFIA